MCGPYHLWWSLLCQENIEIALDTCTTPWHGGVTHCSFAYHGTLFHLGHVAQWPMVFPCFKGSTSNFPLHWLWLIFPWWILIPNTHTLHQKCYRAPFFLFSIHLVAYFITIAQGYRGRTPISSHWWSALGIEPLCFTHILSRARAFVKILVQMHFYSGSSSILSIFILTTASWHGNGVICGIVHGMIPATWCSSPS